MNALGPVQVCRDGVEAELPGSRPRLMLALLLARHGQTVAVAEFVELLWGSSPPSNAVNMVHRQVGAIRRALEPGLPFRAEGSWLLGMPGGYRLRAQPGSSDVLEFHELAERRKWLPALSLWRGPYAQGLATHPAFAAMDRERATTAVAAARAGAGDGLLPLLRALAEENPLDESVAVELIRLLVARGDTEQATSWHHRVSEALADQLGIAPGPELAGVLRDVRTPPAGAPRPPAQLPADLWLFSGRAAELVALSSAAEEFTGAGVICVDGIPGVGKSTLGVHWAHEVAHRFPDGQLFANLRGYDPTGEPAEPGEVLADFLDALGVATGEIPAELSARTGLFRTRTAALRLLIVLDNARTAEQVRPLIPAAPGSLVLVTSRARLSTLAVHEGAVLIGLGLPGRDDARETLRRRLPGTYPDEDLDQVVELCGRLPLAVSIVAARVAGWSGGLGEVLAQLRESRRTLDAFDDDLHGVRAVFSWSYRQLGPPAARLFRLLPVHTGPDASMPMLASLAGRSRSETAVLIRELTRVRLLSEPRAGRFAQHNLIAVYAAEVDDDLPGEADPQAADRLLDHFTRTLEQVNLELLSPMLLTVEGDPLPGVTPESFDSTTAAVEWLRDEMNNFEAVVHDAYRRGRNPWRTVVGAYVLYFRLHRFHRLENLARPGLAAAVAAGDHLAEAHLRRVLAHVTAVIHSDEEGAAGFRRSLALFESLGAEAEQGALHLHLAEIHSLADEPDYALALPCYERAATLMRRAGGHESGWLRAACWLGRCQLETGRTDQGIATLIEVLEHALRNNNRYWLADTFWHIAVAAHRPDAADFLLVALRLYREEGDRFWALLAGVALGERYLAAGRRFDAEGVWRRAEQDYSALATPAFRTTLSTDMRTRLGRLRAEFARAPGRPELADLDEEPRTPDKGRQT